MQSVRKILFLSVGGFSALHLSPHETVTPNGLNTVTLCRQTTDPAISLALSAFFLMHNYPDTAKFLTTAERHEVQRRLEEDQSLLPTGYRTHYLWDALRDWKIWVFSIITIGIFTPLYSISLFLPTIIKGLGYTDHAAQLITVPPYVVACLFCISGGYFADRHGQRGLYIIGFNIVA